MKVFWFKRKMSDRNDKWQAYFIESEDKAWKEYKMVRKYPLRFSYLGWSNGLEYQRIINENSNLMMSQDKIKDMQNNKNSYDEWIKSTGKVIHEAKKAEFLAMKNNPNKTPPRNFDKTDIYGNLPTAELLNVWGGVNNQGIIQG